MRIAAAICCGCVAACGAWAQAEPESYANREFGLYFDVPAGWKLERKPSSGLVSLRDTLGLIEINVAAQIMPKKKDVRDFADKVEAERGRRGKGRALTDLLKSSVLPESQRDVLKPFLYDDVKATDAARIKYEEEKAKRYVDVTGSGSTEDSIPDEPEFLAKSTTRIYEDEAADRTDLFFYVIGGGVGYTISLSAGRKDFYAVLPLAQDAIAAMHLEKLSGGRYALPDAKALAAAKMGIIMGKILYNGKPVGGAGVNLYASAEDRSKGFPSHSARSNSYGEYTFTNLAPGIYYLLDVYSVSDAGILVHSVQPITNIDVNGGRVTFVNVEVVPE